MSLENLFKLLDHCPVFKDGTDANQLPLGWEEKTDPKTGCLYYVDHNTKRTTWVSPIVYSSVTNDKAQDLQGKFTLIEFLTKILIQYY